MRGLHVRGGSLYLEARRLCPMSDLPTVEMWVRRAMGAGVGVGPSLRNLVVKEPPWPVDPDLPEPVKAVGERLYTRPIYHGSHEYIMAHGEAVLEWTKKDVARRNGAPVVKARGSKPKEKLDLSFLPEHLRKIVEACA